MENIYFKARARAFTGEGIATLSICVDSANAVTVWDSCAMHYTSCHSLTRRSINKLIKQAKEIKP